MKSGISYPKAFADSGDMSSAKDDKQKQAMYLFNCAQRSHGNYLENQPSVIAALLIAGTQFPLTTTGLGVGWILSRVLYAVGYTRQDKDKGQGRLVGSGFWLCQFGLFGMAFWTGIKMVL